MIATSTWMALTNLGAAAAILPVVPAIWLGLWQEQRHSVALTWTVALLAAILIVLISKFAFIGWGLGIASLDFTGISGHTLLASAILPVVFAWLPLPRRMSILSTLLAVGLVVLVGWSRVVLGAHSWSEVVAGWGLGALVSGIALFRLQAVKSPQPAQPVMRAFIVTAVLAALSVSQVAAVKLPTHPIEVRLALALSGHDRPYTRIDLHRHARGKVRKELPEDKGV